MPNRIEVSSDIINPEGNKVRSSIVSDLGLDVDNVKIIDVYNLDGDLKQTELTMLAAKLFADPITQKFSIDSPLAKDFDWVIEVGYKPGVTDNVGKTSGQAIKDLTNKNIDVYTSKQYLLRGVPDRNHVEKIAYELLANDLIQNVIIKSASEWNSSVGLGAYIPKVSIKHEPQVNSINLEVADEDLIKISRNNVLALNLEEMKAIQSQYRKLGRSPTDAELESVAQTWSEHCYHKIFKGEIEYRENGKTTRIDSLLKTYIQTATQKIRKSLGPKDWLVSIFSDNAGIVKLDEGSNLAFKVETHNSPSALDPYGGAITGILGVNRDVLSAGLGAKCIANTDVFCFADLNYNGNLPDRIKHPKRVLEGVRKGVEDGGNKSGIPTVNGTVRFDSHVFGSVVEGPKILSYMGKPLVYCGTVGIMPSRIKGRDTSYKKAQPNDLVVMIGGRVGKDGIHGATFSSESLHEGSPATAVQIGDPITQKKMADMLLEARDFGLYNSITDNGAGGLSCSVGEMAKESGGAELDLKGVPLKYSGLDPWEILVSESQERMTLSVPSENIDKFLEVAKKHEVEAAVLGRYTNSGYFRVNYGDLRVADLDLDFLHNGIPKKRMVATFLPSFHEEPYFQQPDLSWALKKLLARLNITSKEFVVRQYDHEVQGSTIVKPLTGVRNDGPSDAAVIWPIEMQQKNSYRGFAVSSGINSNYGLIDAYHMAAANLDEAIRNVVAVGADPNRIAVLDNFCWSSSDEEQRLGQLVRACQALYDNSIIYGTPFISGKDSMYNDYRGKLDGQETRISVPPTLLVSALGIVPDVRKSMTMDVKKPRDLVYVVGSTQLELGGSEYYALVGQELEGKSWIGKSVPVVDAAKAIHRYRGLHKAIKKGYVSAAHDVSDGGLGVALAEMAIAGGFGIDVHLKYVPTRLHREDYILFSESQSRLVVTVPEKYSVDFDSVMRGKECALIGQVRERKALNIYGRYGKLIVNEKLDDLQEAWQGTLRW